MPVRLGKVVASESLSYLLSGAQWVDLDSGSSDVALQRVVNVLRGGPSQLGSRPQIPFHEVLSKSASDVGIKVKHPLATLAIVCSSSLVLALFGAGIGLIYLMSRAAARRPAGRRVRGIHRRGSDRDRRCHLLGVRRVRVGRRGAVARQHVAADGRRGAPQRLISTQLEQCLRRARWLRSAERPSSTERGQRPVVGGERDSVRDHQGQRLRRGNERRIVISSTHAGRRAMAATGARRPKP